jgi:hypothetical protein
LIEDVSNEDIPPRIAARVELELGKYLSLNQTTDGLQALVGIILCGPGYENADQILNDIDFARLLAKGEKKHVLYDRDMLAALRNSVSD